MQQFRWPRLQRNARHALAGEALSHVDVAIKRQEKQMLIIATLKWLGNVKQRKIELCDAQFRRNAAGMKKAGA